MLKLSAIFLMILLLSCSDESKNPVNPENIAGDTDKHQETFIDPAIARDSIQILEYKERLHRSLERSTEQMSKIPLTGIADMDLSKLMIINLFTGIEICRLQQSTGRHEGFKSMAAKELKYFEEHEEFFHSFQLQNITGYRLSKRGKRYEVEHIVVPAKRDIDGVFVAVLGEFNQQTIRLIKNYLPSLTDARMKRQAQSLLNHLVSKNGELQSLKAT